MVDAWLRKKRVEFIPDPLRAKWGRWLSGMVAKSGLMNADDGEPILTADQAIHAVEIVLDPANKEFSYYTYSNPAVEKFQRDWLEVALRLLNGGNGHKDNGGDGQAVPAGFAGIKQLGQEEGWW